VRVLSRWLRSALLLLFIAQIVTSAGLAEELTHSLIFAEKETFAAWPANGGLWTWDDGQEALVCFVTGPYTPREGHNVVPPYSNVLARTRDGGKTWAIERPKSFFQQGMPIAAMPKEGLDFSSPDLAIRVVSDGYHGGGPDSGSLTISTNRGASWQGPFALPQLLPKEKYQITSRTDCHVVSRSELLLMGSARPKDRSQTERVFCVRLVDGGRGSEGLAWVQPAGVLERTIMPSTLWLGDKRLLTTLRVRSASADDNWIDAHESLDGGTTWKHAAKVAETGKGNGNPPALIPLRDGRLFCAYGDRTRLKMFARTSSDQGCSWGPEITLRDDYDPDAAGEIDLGYPRAFQSPDGTVNVVYYWADKDHETNFIAVTRWTPR
jgi:hypothetical protein